MNNNRELKDFYFSSKSFNQFVMSMIDNREIVCECFIGGRWIPFTEQISANKKPLSVWDDLIYLGSSNEVRYTRASEWLSDKLIK